jgi:DNA-directed RNA polymerase specialized sigma24 family protein
VIPRIQAGTVEFARLSRLYAARAGTRPPPLDAAPTLAALLSALFGRDQGDAGTRCRLLCAVLAEHQAAPGPLGAAIALHAFRGMLVRLSRSLVGVDDPDEADALVVAGLLEALKRVRPGHDPDRIGMYVRQETRRAVFAALRRDARAREYQGEPDEDEVLAREAHEASETEEPETEGEESHQAADGDDAWCEEPMRDPLALQRASRQRLPDDIADHDSLAPIEDQLLLVRPSVDEIPDETLLRAHAVRGGLRRLTNLLFENATPTEQDTLYRQVVRRTRALLATMA